MKNLKALSPAVRVTAVAVAAALPLSVLSVTATGGAGVFGPTPAAAQESIGATVSAPFENRAAADAADHVGEKQSGWRDAIYTKEGASKDGVEEVVVTSQANGGREIPVVIIRAKNDAANAPTLYLLNGADGGEGSANWLQQTTAVDFYRNHVGNVNVVIPMAGKLSYYTDWQETTSDLDTDAAGRGGKQMWETFLTDELPVPMESYLGTSSGKRALIGMSMTGSTSLVYAQKHKGLYDAIGAFSGCASTSGPMSETVQFVLSRGNAQYSQMWGNPSGSVARENDALVNAAELKGQHNVYVSSNSGLAGEHDMPSGDIINGRTLLGSAETVTVGTVIEGATNACTHMLKSTTDAAGITEASNNLVYNFRPTGTHQWGYWQDDMFDSWPTISAGLFGKDSVPGARALTQQAKDEHLAANPGAGPEGSTTNTPPLG